MCKPRTDSIRRIESLPSINDIRRPKHSSLKHHRASQAVSADNSPRNSIKKCVSFHLSDNASGTNTHSFGRRIRTKRTRIMDLLKPPQLRRNLSTNDLLEEEDSCCLLPAKDLHGSVIDLATTSTASTSDFYQHQPTTLLHKTSSLVSTEIIKIYHTAD